MQEKEIEYKLPIERKKYRKNLCLGERTPISSKDKIAFLDSQQRILSKVLKEKQEMTVFFYIAQWLSPIDEHQESIAFAHLLTYLAYHDHYGMTSPCAIRELLVHMKNCIVKIARYEQFEVVTNAICQLTAVLNQPELVEYEKHQKVLNLTG